MGTPFNLDSASHQNDGDLSFDWQNICQRLFSVEVGDSASHQNDGDLPFDGQNIYQPAFFLSKLVIVHRTKTMEICPSMGKISINRLFSVEVGDSASHQNDGDLPFDGQNICQRLFSVEVGDSVLRENDGDLPFDGQNICQRLFSVEVGAMHLISSTFNLQP